MVMDEALKKKYRKVAFGLVGAVLTAAVASIALTSILETEDHHKHHSNSTGNGTSQQPSPRSSTPEGEFQINYLTFFA